MALFFHNIPELYCHMKILLFIVLIAEIVIWNSCIENPEKDVAYHDFREFVIQHRDSSVNLFLEYPWPMLDSVYNDKKVTAEKKISRWNDNMKAEFVELQSDWESFREDYEAEKERRENLEKSANFVYTVLPQGIDESLANMNATNVVIVYRHLVAYVEKEGDEFSPQQWSQIETLWDRLMKRYDNLKDSLNRAEKAAISEQKIRFDVVTAINKPVATMQEDNE